MPDAGVLERPFAIEDTKRLAEALSRGAHFEPLQVPGLRLCAGEDAYAEVDVEAWRWLATEAVYERRSVMLGGPALMAATGLACAAANHRRRLDAERAARPRWRALGIVRVVVTDRRLLLWHEGSWWSVPFEDVRTWDLEAGRTSLTLILHDGAPYHLAGAAAPLLSLVILWLSALGRPGAR